MVSSQQPQEYGRNMVTKTTTSFGEYYDIQYDKMRKAMENKDAKQHIEWMEEYEKRQQARQKKEK